MKAKTAPTLLILILIGIRSGFFRKLKFILWLFAFYLFLLTANEFFDLCQKLTN